MAEIYRMPSISPTMTVGTIAEWHVPEGAAFESGTVIADIGTDKATMEAEVFDDGVMLAHLAGTGDEVPTGAPMAILGTSVDEDITALLAQAKAELSKAAAAIGSEETQSSATPPPASPPSTKPVAKTTAAPAPAPGNTERSWHGKELPPTFMDPPGDIRAVSTQARVQASPLAKRVADDLGVDLRRVEGTGPRGRIVQADVESAAKAPASTSATRPDEHLPLTPMRKTIARRLLESHQEIPTFFLTTALDVTGFVQLRTQLKAQLPDVRVSYNDMLIAAVARALHEYPMANASWTPQGIVKHGRVDVGIAVALPEGLITPVLRHAETLRLSDIGAQVRDLATRARAQRLKPDEYTGGTFTISNLGMFGIDHFTAIINPPEAAILAVGKVAEVPVVHKGTLGVGWRMSVTLTCDHRVLDGMAGAQFLQVLRRYVETPALLLV
jgi:pyruvate dehydrogenase E2 component (dihydrolipoamide acetyltransferase)